MISVTVAYFGAIIPIKAEAWILDRHFGAYSGLCRRRMPAPVRLSCPVLGHLLQVFLEKSFRWNPEFLPMEFSFPPDEIPSSSPKEFSFPPDETQSSSPKEFSFSPVVSRSVPGIPSDRHTNCMVTILLVQFWSPGCSGKPLEWKNVILKTLFLVFSSYFCQSLREAHLIFMQHWDG